MNAWTVEMFAAGLALQVIGEFGNIHDPIEKRAWDAHQLYRKALRELIRLDSANTAPTPEPAESEHA